MTTAPNDPSAAPRNRRPTPQRRIDLARRAQIGEEKRARTRRQVLAAAFELLGRERGLSTRIEEICEAAQISRGTFYNYFMSMQDLFDALSYEIGHDFNVNVNTAIGRLPEAAERISAAVRFYLDRALRDQRWGWAMVNVSAGGPIFGSDAHLAAAITAQEGIDSGEFDLPSAALGRDLQLGAGLAAMLTQLREPQPANYSAQVAGRVLLALGVDRGQIPGIVSRALPESL